MTIAAAPYGLVGGQARVRLWLQIGFWAATAAVLLLLTGVQFGPAATISILAITITKATPITLGALAGICCERSGVVNIGIEGMMLTAAFSGFMAGVYTHNLVFALVMAVASGGADGAVARCAVDHLQSRPDHQRHGGEHPGRRLDGLFESAAVRAGAPPGLSVFPSIPFGPLTELPWIGPILFQQKPVALTAIVFVIVLHFALFRTRWGLRTRAVGEHPLAADTVGVNVNALCATTTSCLAER